MKRDLERRERNGEEGQNYDRGNWRLLVEKVVQEN